MLQLSQENTHGKGTCRNTGELDLYSQKFPPLVPDWSIFMQMRTLNPHSLIGPKVTVQNDQNRAVLVGQGCAADWIGEASVLLVEVGFQ